MKKFDLVTELKPSGDQIKAIKELTENIESKNIKSQVLLGATGTGKTFTIANVIKNLNKKTLIMVHNKTLAAQLYSEIKELFPNNKVEFFISYFDYYQPEAYLASKDLYIEKSSITNHEIEKLRISTLNSLAHHDDVIVIASVAAIYASVSKKDFLNSSFKIQQGMKLDPDELKKILVKLNYKFNPINLVSGNFRYKGDVFDIVSGFNEEEFIRISFFGDEIEDIKIVDLTTFKTIKKIDFFILSAANEYIVNEDNISIAINNIREELKERVEYYQKNNQLLEASRIKQRTEYDLEAISEFGYCSGVENYSRHLEHRELGSTPYTIFDFFNDNKDWLLIVDESHISLPQIRGMHNTDRSRKLSLVEHGFRLPSALDNRPLNYDEFLSKLSYSIFVSATPNEWEIQHSNNNIVQQIVRPTGLLDPIIEIKPINHQIDSILFEIQNQIKNNERTFINVMTIRMAEELSKFFQKNKIKAMYLHNELNTIERSKVINDLRKGVYDVVIGINLLREGLDVPEVSLVMILDADKNGFFRSDKSLIQIIGRAARNANGRVIMYADEMTESMEIAIKETNRRRQIQMDYNKANNITPKTIIKPIREDFNNSIYKDILEKSKKNKESLEQTIKKLKKQMLEHSKVQEYEKAAELRDLIIELQASKELNKEEK